jgi:hypothetical protein
MIESAHRALRILESFGLGDGDLSAAEIAERVQLPKSSVQRLLATLGARGYLAGGDSPRRYRLGIRLFELGCSAVSQRQRARASDSELPATRPASARSWRPGRRGTAVNFNHVSVSALDLETSLRFYEDLFGVERIPTPNTLASRSSGPVSGRFSYTSSSARVPPRARTTSR